MGDSESVGVKSIMTQWPRRALQTELEDKDMGDWCLESYLDGVNYAYTGATLNKPLTQDYINAAWQVVRKRLALGGYRLSDMLATAY